MFVRSIRWQLVASYVLLTLLIVSLVGLLALAQVKRQAQQQELEYLTSNAESVVRQALPFMHPILHPVALDKLAYTSSFLGDVRVRILSARKQALADSGPRNAVGQTVWAVLPDEQAGALIITQPDVMHPGGGPPGHPPHEALQLPPGTQYSIVRREQRAWGDRFVFETFHPQQPSAPETGHQLAAEMSPRSELAVTLPIGEPEAPLGYVELSGGPNFRAEALATTRRAFGVAAVAAALLALLLGLHMSRRLTAPLSKLAQAAARMSSGDLSTRAGVQREDEIGLLARRFNLMAERLEASFMQVAAERDALRRFVADASHELRTPITALKTFNELLEDTADRDPAARREFLVESRAQIRRLEWVTHNLLDLSRFDAGLINAELAPHDAGELLQSAATPFRTLAHDKGIELSLEMPAPALAILCDRSRIELAIANLLDNALKFTPSGGWIRAGCEQTDRVLRLWVRDNGPGIAEEEQPHIFERFYRGRSVQAGGSGLGLAIVRSIAELHKGRAWAESRQGDGTTVVLEIPLRTAAAQSAASPDLYTIG